MNKDFPILTYFLIAIAIVLFIMLNIQTILHKNEIDALESNIDAAYVDFELQIDEAYNNGYEDGYADGYEDGWEDGSSVGYSDGYEEGYADGVKE